MFEYLRCSEAGNVLTVTIGVLGFVARFFNNKLEQMRKESAESRKESAAEMREMKKESAVLTQAVNSLTNQISTKFVEQDVNIQKDEGRLRCDPSRAWPFQSGNQAPHRGAVEG